MKKLLLSIITLSVTSVATFAQCNELIISKFMRGVGNTKGMEFYNPTANPIDLTAGKYSIERYKSVSATGVIDNIMDDSLYLRGVVPAFGTWVLVNGQSAANSSPTSPEPDPAFQAVANQLDLQYGTYGANVGQPMYFKGNDCLVLRKNGVIIDVFGEVNTTVTTAWSTIAPYRGGSGMGKWVTTRFLLERKASVKSGRIPPTPSDLTTFTEFNPLAEYDTIPQLPANATAIDSLDLYALFGAHTCDCTTGINDLSLTKSASIYPNPSDNVIYISSTYMINKVELYNSMGVLVAVINAGDKNLFQIDTKSFSKGIYFVKTTTKYGDVLNNKVLFN
jgi:hypothetical protein